jgi:hypothetical protein
MISYMLIITDMATMRSIEDIRDRINMDGICGSGNYVHKWVTKLYSYQFIVIL